MLDLSEHVTSENVQLLAAVVAAHRFLRFDAVLVPGAPKKTIVVRGHDRRDSNLQSLREILEFNIG